MSKSESQNQEHPMTTDEVRNFTVMIEGSPVVVEARSVGEASELALAKVAEGKQVSSDTSDGGTE